MQAFDSNYGENSAAENKLRNRTGTAPYFTRVS